MSWQSCLNLLDGCDDRDLLNCEAMALDSSGKDEIFMRRRSRRSEIEVSGFVARVGLVGWV